MSYTDLECIKKHAEQRIKGRNDEDPYDSGYMTVMDYLYNSAIEGYGDDWWAGLRNELIVIRRILRLGKYSKKGKCYDIEKVITLIERQIDKNIRLSEEYGGGSKSAYYMSSEEIDELLHEIVLSRYIEICKILDGFYAGVVDAIDILNRCGVLEYLIDIGYPDVDVLENERSAENLFRFVLRHDGGYIININPYENEEYVRFVTPEDVIDPYTFICDAVIPPNKELADTVENMIRRFHERYSEKMRGQNKHFSPILELDEIMDYIEKHGGILLYWT